MNERWRIPNSKPWITMDDERAVALVLRKVMLGEFAAGSEVAAFERELAEFLGRKYVVCVSSGTLALELAYRAAGGAAPAGCPAFGFVATANAMERSGGIMRGFYDRPLYTAPLGEQPDSAGQTLSVVDAAQAFGAKLPPSLADCYSFNWNKPITCLGGGCVATDDEALDYRLRMLRNHGRAVGVEWGADCLGTNARLSDMQAALGRSQLRRVGEIRKRRREVFDLYLGELAPAHVPPKPEIPFLYPIELSNRDEVHAKMLERGIQTRSCADWLLPAHPYYAGKYGYKRGDFPEAERRADRTLLLPLFPEMTLDQVREVCEALEECDARV